MWRNIRIVLSQFWVKHEEVVEAKVLNAWVWCAFGNVVFGIYLLYRLLTAQKGIKQKLFGLTWKLFMIKLKGHF